MKKKRTKRNLGENMKNNGSRKIDEGDHAEADEETDMKKHG